MFLYIVEGDARAAVDQIDMFLTSFPDSWRADGFRKIRVALKSSLAEGDAIEVKEVEEWPRDVKRGW